MSDFQDRTDLRRFLIVGIVVGLLVLLTTPLWLFGGKDEPPPPKEPQPSQSHLAASMCGLEDGGQSIPTEGPTAKWVLVGRTAIPTNKRIGPGSIEDGVPECFARSPIGAVFAGMSVFAAARNDDASAERLSDRLAKPDGSKPGGDDPTVFQFVGFRVDHYDSKHATVTLPVRATTGSKSGGLAAVTVDFMWAKGDWRVRGLNLTSLASTAGFVEWSGA